VNPSLPVPPYFDHLIEAFYEGGTGRHVHLGHWDNPPPLSQPPVPGEFEKAQARLNAVLLEMADLGNGQRVLDVGCGFGGNLARINSIYSEMLLAGINIDSRQLDICRSIKSTNGNEFRWVNADACCLPFKEQQFERVFCIEAMFHFSSRERFFEEVARVMCPGASLVVSDILVADTVTGSGVPGFMVEKLLREGYSPWPQIWESRVNYQEMASSNGLKLMGIHDATSATLPTHRFTVPPGTSEDQDPVNPMLTSALTLRWLHREGHLRYFYLRFDK
tara:strand:+ start:4201 stop:5031 length:831 start_codon:yes stop_codon:yes gene_type:complete